MRSSLPWCADCYRQHPMDMLQTEFCCLASSPTVFRSLTLDMEKLPVEVAPD